VTADDINDLGAASARTTWDVGGDGTTVSLIVENLDRPLRRVEFRLYELLGDRLDALVSAPEKMLEEERPLWQEAGFSSDAEFGTHVLANLAEMSGALDGDD
jgi:hypothetical protein